MLKFGDFLPFSFCFAGFKCYSPFLAPWGFFHRLKIQLIFKQAVAFESEHQFIE